MLLRHRVRQREERESVRPTRRGRWRRRRRLRTRAQENNVRAAFHRCHQNRRRRRVKKVVFIVRVWKRGRFGTRVVLENRRAEASTRAGVGRTDPGYRVVVRRVEARGGWRRERSFVVVVVVVVREMHKRGDGHDGERSRRRDESVRDGVREQERKAAQSSHRVGRFQGEIL